MLKLLSRASALSLATALVLSGCNNPSQTAMMPASASEEALAAVDTPVAPAAEALPPAPKPKVVYVSRPADRYAYVDDAYAMNDAFGDAPPDYSFAYDGGRPLAWLAADNALRLVEPIAGGERYYYYRPGATEPYLVRDNDYAYAYSGGRLVTVYDSRGRALAEADAERRADYAGRYLARAQALAAAARRDRRERVTDAAWAVQQPRIDRGRDAWVQQQRSDSDWRAWHDAHAPQVQARWHGESVRRSEQAAVWRSRQQAAVAQARTDQAHADAARVAQARADAQAARQQARLDRIHAASQARVDQSRINQARTDQARVDAARVTQARAAAQAARQQARLDRGKPHAAGPAHGHDHPAPVVAVNRPDPPRGHGHDRPAPVVAAADKPHSGPHAGPHPAKAQPKPHAAQPPQTAQAGYQHGRGHHHDRRQGD